MTDLLTYTFFMTRFSQKVQFGGALLYIDVDQFQFFNAVFGHDTGDQVVKELAAILADESLETTLIARCSGEEFLVYDRSEVFLHEYAEAVRQRVELRFENERAIVRRDARQAGLIEPPPGGLLTFSIGLFHIEEGTTDVNGIVDGASRLCFEAKMRGGNAVCAGAA